MKIVRKQNLNKFQQLSDDYINSNHPNSNIKIKFIAGIALASTTIALLTGCSKIAKTAEEKYGKGEYEIASNDVEEDIIGQKEELLEKELAKYLSEQTGVKIEIIDIHDIDLIQSSGNYVVLTGKVITDIKKGSQECSITLEVSDEQLSALQNSMQRQYHKRPSGEFYTADTSSTADTLALKYRNSFLSTLKDTMDDDKTIVSAIYDKDNKEWLFDKEEPTFTNNR